jgi:beta-glucosidase/6-phospho-beta-glucosidase/beta-galactosidase
LHAKKLVPAARLLIYSIFLICISILCCRICHADKRAAQNKIDIDFGWFADAIHFGDYPAQAKKTQSAFLPVFTDAEKKLLRRSYDYMGLTIYTAKYASEVPGNPNGWWVRTTDVNGK